MRVIVLIREWRTIKQHGVLPNGRIELPDAALFYRHNA